MAAGTADLPAESPAGETSVDAPLCHNCGAIAAGRYCSECGQTTQVHMPTLFEFLHEFVSHHVAFEGTLVASLKRLLFSPGRLTLDYFDGKRARYVAPLRLYLTFNVIFFLAVEIFQVIGLGSIGQDADAKKALSQVKLSDASAAIDAASKEILADPSLTPEQRQAAAAKLAMLSQYAAHSAVPDALSSDAQKSRGASADTSAADGSARSSGNGSSVPDKKAPGSAAVPATSSAPSKASSGSNFNFTFGTAPAADTSASNGSSVSATGLPVKSITALGQPAKDDDDDDDEESNKKDARSEVLESARDAALAAAPADKPAITVVAPKTGGVTIKKVENSTIPPWVDRYAPIVRRRIDEVGERTPDQNLQHLRENGLHYAPYTLLALLPVCAFLLQISFIGRHRGYVEHLVAALHGHTFLFIVLLVLVPLGEFNALLASLWVLLALIHMIWALSRIYGSRGIGLFMRLGVLAVTYGMAMLFATIFAVFISVLT